MRTLLLAISLSFTAGVASAAPPPPPPEYIANAAQTLTAQITPDNFGAYAAVFASDTRVFLDGAVIAANKATWTALQKALVGKVDRKIIGYSEGINSLFVVDQYDDRSALATSTNLLLDARYVTRAEVYEFGPDHLIHQVRIVQGGGMPWRSGD